MRFWCRMINTGTEISTFNKKITIPSQGFFSRSFSRICESEISLILDMGHQKTRPLNQRDISKNTFFIDKPQIGQLILNIV